MCRRWVQGGKKKLEIDHFKAKKKGEEEEVKREWNGKGDFRIEGF